MPIVRNDFYRSYTGIKKLISDVSRLIVPNEKIMSTVISLFCFSYFAYGTKYYTRYLNKVKYGIKYYTRYLNKVKYGIKYYTRCLNKVEYGIKY